MSCGCTELPVAESASSSFEEHDFLSVVGDIADIFTCLGIVNHRTAGHIDIDVLAICAVAFVAAAVATVLGEDVALVFQVQQSPVVMVAAQDDAAAFSAVAAVGSAVGLVFDMSQVHGAAPTFSGTTVYLNVVYEVGIHI